MVLISDLPLTGISRSIYLKWMTACPDLMIYRFMSLLESTLNKSCTPKSGSVPPNCTSLFLKPQSSQEKEEMMISRKKGMIVNMRMVVPFWWQFMHMLSTTVAVLVVNYVLSYF